jgi:hypothetical protein
MPPNFNPQGSNNTVVTSVISQKAMTFMSNVVALDMSKYSTNMGTMNLSAISGVPNEEMVKYSLTASGNNLDVVFIFRDNTIVWCKLYSIEGSPLYAQSQTNALTAAYNILNNYQTYSQAAYVPTFKSMLSLTTIPENVTNVTNNIAQQVSINGSSASIQWSYSISHITDNYKIVSLTVQNGGLTFFQDNWNFFTVGNATVNIPQSEAVGIAKEKAQSYSYTEGSNNQTVSNFIFSTIAPMASLSMQDRGNGILYPQWDIYLPLNGSYPDGVTAIHVLEWADNGQVSFIAAIGGGGAPPIQSSGQDTTPSQTKASFNVASSDVEALAVLMLVAAATIGSYLIYKRRR